jgi:hypothetical protein
MRSRNCLPVERTWVYSVLCFRFCLSSFHDLCANLTRTCVNIGFSQWGPCFSGTCVNTGFSQWDCVSQEPVLIPVFLGGVRVSQEPVLIPVFLGGVGVSQEPVLIPVFSLIIFYCT